MENILKLKLSDIYQHRKESVASRRARSPAENVFSLCAALKTDGLYLDLAEIGLCCDSVFPLSALLFYLSHIECYISNIL